MTLVALYCVRKLSHMLPRPISLEIVQKVNRPNSLPITKDVYSELNLKFDAAKEHFSGCGDRIHNIFFHGTFSQARAWIKITKYPQRDPQYFPIP